MPKILKKTEFGNPILRSKLNKLSKSEILSKSTKVLLKNMYFTLENKKYGVGFAANQVGQDKSLCIIDTKPTPTRPKLKRQKLTIINPVITNTYGNKTQKWEGCISGPNLYALVPRYNKIKLKWTDEKAINHEKDFAGIMAHVIQHEVDHLNGILFVDKVKDTKSYLTFSEYKKMKIKEIKEKSKKVKIK